MSGGCERIVLRNDTGERRPCGKKIFKGRYCESCFYDELARLNQEYEKYRKAMFDTVDEIKNLFGQQKDDGNGREEN